MNLNMHRANDGSTECGWKRGKKVWQSRSRERRAATAALTKPAFSWKGPPRSCTLVAVPRQARDDREKGYDANMSDEADPVPARVPKYKAPDFMRKEIELFLRARNETVLIRRHGDDDSPVPRVMPLEGIRSIRSVGEINSTTR